MGAAEALGDGERVSLHDLRPLVGARVAAETVGGSLEGTLLSCSSRSAWIVVDDLDHVVPLPLLFTIQRR